jgi:site-specific DNA recombinase
MTEVPELRIIDPMLWDAVKARQTALDRRANQVPQSSASAPFWSKQRPRYLFSGLMRCAICGGGFSKIGATRFGCSSARNKGPTACANRLTIRRDVLEASVLDGLQHRLMNPDLFKVFVAEFTAEWNRVQATSSAEQAAHQAELTQVRRQIDRLVDALVDGTPASAVKDRLTALEHRRLVLEESLATAVAPAPRLHPNLAENYRQKVATLTDLLEREDAAEARNMVRGLVEKIVLVPEGERLRIEIHGELARILGLVEGARNAKGIADAGAVAQQIKAVAGRGFEPLTFRL